MVENVSSEDESEGWGVCNVCDEYAPQGIKDLREAKSDDILTDCCDFLKYVAICYYMLLLVIIYKIYCSILFILFINNINK